MERRKLTKEDIDKVRNIEGFPIGTDEDIIALSDAPYYTACPNPFIEEFIKENGTPYDEATDDYHREPFAADVSEGKSDAIYNAHTYHTSVGLGRLMGAGLETETKSHKMVVLKGFANKANLIEKYGLLEYPKYYLPKEYDYLICNVGESLDIKGEEVMTHGGISLDEVVVPFISIRAEDYNG